MVILINLNKWDALNENEQTIYKLIKKDPFISQQELADHLSLSRPSVANMISGLVRKGYILGKAYVLNEEMPVICIGGANVDRKFYIKDALEWGTSNPIHSSQNAGGVARNVAENLGRLGLTATLLTTSGADADWSFIKKESLPYVNTEYVFQLPEETTGSYTAVLDETGEMVVGFADMDVYDKLTPETIHERSAILSQAKCLVADLNCPKDTLDTLEDFANNHDIPLALITVSGPKMKRMPDNLSGITWLITNRDETESYFDEKITSDEDWQRAVQKYLDLGISNVVITSGAKGAMIGNAEEGIHHILSVKPAEIIDVTGAGDAFSSAVIYSWLEGDSLIEIGNAGVVNAVKTLESRFTVRQNLSAAQLQNDLEELK